MPEMPGGRIDERPTADALLRYVGDGMLDLFLGLVMIDASVALVGGSFTSSGVGFVVIYLLLLAAKEQVTGPRLAARELARASRGCDPRRPRGRGWTVLTLLACGSVVLLLWLGQSRPAMRSLGSDGSLWSLVALGGLAAVAYAGHRLAAPRFIAYAGATAVALVCGVWAGVAPLALLILGIGVGITAIGGVILGRFLRRHPRINATG